MGPPASLYGLHLAPCDPLVLAVPLDGRPLRGLTGHVDWRIGGALSSLIRAGRMPADGPLLLPPSPFLPVGRLLLWTPTAFELDGLVARIAGLRADTPGLCPADFGLDAAVARQALGEQAVLYSLEAEDG